MSVLPVLLTLFLCLSLASADSRNTVNSYQSGTKPNVLLLLVDDLKPALGCYGDPLAKTPNIDRLAGRGMRFELAYCNQAVCAPSRNNLLLGSRSTSLGIYSLSQNFRLAVPDAITLPQHFREYGYKAEAVGKVLHVGHGNVDDLVSWSVPPIPEKVVEYLLPESSDGGKLTREEAYFSNQKLGEIRSLPKGYAWEAAEVGDDGYADGRIANHGIAKLRQAAKDPRTPFFITLGFVKPHLPFTAPTKYWEMHNPDHFAIARDQEDPEGAPVYARKRGGEIVNYAPLTVENLKGDSMQRKLLHGYYASASYADAQIGRVLDELDQLGLADNTIVVLWGDHGWHLGDHGYWTKHTNYEQCNRIPLIFVAPGVTTPGSSTRQLAETVDIFPTLADLAGLPEPSGPQPQDGISLKKVLKDPFERVRDHAYGCYPKGKRLGRSIRTERYRLVEWAPTGQASGKIEYELYDYVEDFGETRNMAAERPDVMARLKQILSRHPPAKPRF